MSAHSPSVLALPSGVVALPAFLPDATHGVVRSVDSCDLEAAGVQAVVMSTFHLMQRPGSSTVRALGGLHRMCGWSRPIVTDSGGFQAYSLIRQNPKWGTLSDNGLAFRPEGSSHKVILTPEKAVRLQLSYGSDLVVCLDDCTHPDASEDVQREAVERTIAWARRGKQEYTRVLEQKGVPEAHRPLLMGVIQGGLSPELRRRCANALLELGFDVLGYGGWPLDAAGNLLLDVLAYTRELVPLSIPMHALGVGHPVNLAFCVRIGYSLFDSAMPTRDARHGRLYVLPRGETMASVDLSGDWLRFVHPGDAKHIKSKQPVMPGCDCACCTRYPLAYLHHLLKVGDGLFQRLATIHNLRFMVLLTQRLAAAR